MGMKVLIVDDSALMRRIVGKALREAGLDIDEVFEAGNGVEGIATLERLAAEGQAPHLVLCDVHMPVMDGVGFLLERAARGLVGAPVVMVTADASDPLVALALSSGARGFIAKPFSAEQIRAQVLAIAEGK
jgi:two-component system chemotaxis response regulator CheY